MGVSIQHIKLLDKKNRKAEFSVVLSDGKNQVILPKVVAVAGSRGIFCEPHSKNIQEKKSKDWKEIPYYYWNKDLKAAAEKLIIEHLQAIEKK